jgi:hypothetical protein
MALKMMSVPFALLALALALPAQALTDKEAERLAEYQRFAGEPVGDMPFWRLQKYEAFGTEALVVWTAVNTAWLIKVQSPCTELPWASAVGLSSNGNRVSAKFDHVVVGKDRCTIASIQPVDYKALRAARKDEKAAKQD